MRVVNAEYKDIQAGVWENLNSNVPSGAARIADNVDFPEAGGVKTRYGFRTGGRFTNNLRPLTPIRSGNGKFVSQTRDDQWGATCYSGVLEPAPQALGGNHALAVGGMPVADKTLMLGIEKLSFAGTEVKTSTAAFFEVESVGPGTTYTINWGGGTASWTSQATYDPSIKLDISGISPVSGAATEQRKVIRLNTSYWKEDKEFPDYLTTDSIPSQSYIRVLTNANTVDGKPGGVHLMGPLWNPTDNNPMMPEDGLGGAGNATGDGNATWRPLIRKDGTLKDRIIEFDYGFNEFLPNPLYNLELQKKQNKYNEELAAHTAAVAKETSRSYVATKLKEAVEAAGGTVELFGTVVRVEGATQATASDDGPGNHLRATFNETTSAGYLPPKAKSGDTLMVNSVPFRFNGSAWKEIAGGDITVTNKALFFAEDSDFIPASSDPAGLEIKIPTAGTWDTLKGVIGEHRPVMVDSRAGRLVLVTTRGVFVSGVGRPLDFFPSSAVDVNPADGFYLDVTTSNYDMVRAGLLTEDRLLLVTNRRCYLIRVGSVTDTVVSRLEVQGPGEGSEVWLVSTVLGPLLVTQGNDRRVSVHLFSPSTEGTRYTTVPYLQQMSKDAQREDIIGVTVNTGGTKVCVAFGKYSWLIDIAEQPRVRTYSGIGNKWMGYVEDDLVAFQDNISYVQSPLKDQDDDMPSIQASITFHAPPEWRAYAPDTRYTFKQFGVWVQSGPFTLTVGKQAKSFKDGAAYYCNLPVHMFSEREPTVSTNPSYASKPWHIKTAAYSLVVRNGKTPAGW